MQSVPQFPEVFREIFRTFRPYFPVAVDGGIEGEHDSVLNVFRMLTVEAVPGNQLAVVQQLQYSVSVAQHLSLRYALILIFFISYRVFNNFGVIVFHHDFVLCGEAHTAQTKRDIAAAANRSMKTRFIFLLLILIPPFLLFCLSIYYIIWTAPQHKDCEIIIKTRSNFDSCGFSAAVLL